MLDITISRLYGTGGKILCKTNYDDPFLYHLVLNMEQNQPGGSQKKGVQPHQSLKGII